MIENDFDSNHFDLKKSLACGRPGMDDKIISIILSSIILSLNFFCTP